MRSPQKRRFEFATVVALAGKAGATMRTALRATRLRNAKKLVLAVPVAATDILSEMRQEADEIVCLEDYPSFGAIGLYYAASS